MRRTMKNVNIFPFERNHYYYGKLLTVEDFELEQRYMNNKRRLMNRFYHGMGVVFGMNVVEVDDRTICVKPGYALDSTGRELLLTDGVTKKLSHIDGFESFRETEQSYAYLCAEYDEEKSEVVYNAAGEDRLSGGNEYNKCLETCRLFISCHEPVDPGSLSQASVYENKTVIYAGNGIRICHILPKFVEAGEEFELAVEIENMGQQQSFAFSYELELQYLKYQNSPRLKIDFNEKLMDKAHKYRKTYRLKAQDATEAQAFLKVSGDSIKIVVRNQVSTDVAKGRTEIFVTCGNASLRAAAHFYETEMESVSGIPGIQGIYLAKIYLVMEEKHSREEETYVIQHIDPMPFEQYMWSTRMNVLQHQFLAQEVIRLKAKLAQADVKMPGGEPKTSGQHRNLSYGSCRLEIGKQKGKVYLTGEIPHGLGIGEVNIRLGIGKMEERHSTEEGHSMEKEYSMEKEVVWGSHKVFQDMDPKLELAAKVYRDKGTFIIGARLLEVSKCGQCTIYWRAEKNPEAALEDNNEKAIVIKPNFLNVNVRETVYIEAECRNMNDKRLKWTVEKYGGIIDKNGMYTAPDREGIYEITVSSFVYPGVNASVYAVVRNSMEEGHSMKEGHSQGRKDIPLEENQEGQGNIHGN